MAGSDGLTWNVSSATVNVGETITVSATYGMQPTASGLTGAFNGLATAAVGSGGIAITGVTAGTVTVPAGTDVGGSVITANAFTLTVVGSADDEEYLNKRGLTHFWENIDSIKQDKLTAGAGISITGNTISATGGGTADAVDWGHITGSMSSQTDLMTALNAKANSADLATVATSGSYNDLTNKPTIPSLTSRTSASAPATVGSLVLGGNGTSTLPYAFPTIVGSTNDESFWSYIRTTDITNGISEAYLGAYEFDPTESWWSGKKEARLALYSDIPTVPTKTSDLTNDSGFLTSVAWGDVTGKPTFATVATSGSYNDLSNKPTIPAAQVNSDWNATSGKAQILNKPTLATVATSGSYNDLSNLPTIPTVNNATLTIQKNGTTVKTFTANASSNVTANITVPTTVSELSDASNYATITDLAGKQDTLTAGDNISITSNTISADTGWVYLGEQSLSANSDTLTYTLPAQYDNYKVVFYGTMASTASDGGWVDFIMLNGSTAINVVHQVQLVEGTTWSSAWNSGTFAMNGQINPYAGVTITFESFRAGSADWRVYKGSFCSNAGGSATTRSTIVNGRATSGTQPTAFQVKSYSGDFITGSSMRVWASNNGH